MSQKEPEQKLSPVQSQFNLLIGKIKMEYANSTGQAMSILNDAHKVTVDSLLQIITNYDKSLHMAQLEIAKLKEDVERYTMAKQVKPSVTIKTNSRR
jgi:hypothetical protein